VYLHFTKGKVRRKERERILEIQRVWTLSPTLQERRERKGETDSPK